ncbi:peroxisome biosynthesis protein [Trichophyton equinum CBS 127.97]|uniref:Peroxin-7 n=1 Tax=Trichophyton equinum (strain ATCC MYA-4606 / CBS 127.97) TaxID=559882 RepID=F2PRB7_TRIEC|nr:peroxisome biosynthesis protein [Trichophyton equinum CBS 127.97]
MLEYRTEGFNGCAVKYSPFFDSRIAVAASSNFGLVGNGRFYILNLTPQGILPQQSYTTQDALYDVAWSEIHENQALVASGDGSIKLFDIAVNEFPVQGWKEHSREVFSVHWNLVAKDRFSSTMMGHEYAIRKVSWSPHLSHVLLSASYDMTCRVWTDGSEGTPPGDADLTRSGPTSTIGRELGRMGRHTEFVTGIDWCLFGSEGWCASCGWDERLCVWDARAIMA